MPIAKLRSFARALAGRRNIERDLSEEMLFHIERRSQDLISRDGLSEAEARRQAKMEFGSMEKYKEEGRQSLGLRMVDEVTGDVRYAVRQLRRSPGFALVAILAIGLGVGLNTGIFTVLNGIAIRSLPVPESHELVNVHQSIVNSDERRFNGSRSMFSTSEYRTYRDNSGTLSGLVAFAPFVNATLGEETPVQVPGEMVTCNYFEVLQLQLLLGAGFQNSDCELGAPPAVVLGHSLWTSRFGANTNILGQTIVLNRRNFRVAGVAREGFDGVEIVRATFWAPIETQPILEPDGDFYNDENVSWLFLFGRRADGVELEQVRAELGSIAARIDQQEPPRETAVLVRPASYLSSPVFRGTLMPISAVLMAGFGLVLLIACANVANLLLARAIGRTKEIAIRLSVGGTRNRLLRQLLTESLLIGLAGSAVGSVLAASSTQALVDKALVHLPVGVSLNIDTSPDLRVFWFALGLSLVTATAFGLVPALQASKADLVGGLKQDDAGSGTSGIGWLRSGLVVVQVAVSMVLMIAAGLLMLGLYGLQTLEPGLNYDNVTVVSMDLEGSGYSIAQGAAFHSELMERFRALPGVEGIAQASVTPFEMNRRGGLVRLNGENAGREVLLNDISPGYLELLEIPILRGRDFDPSDISDFPSSVIVTQSTARRFWPAEDPLGQTMEFGAGLAERQLLQVVGIAADSQVAVIGDHNAPFIYLPTRLNFESVAELTC